MRVARSLILATLLLLAIRVSALGAEPCGGGTLDIVTTSNLPFSGTTFNVGQEVTLTAQAVGVTPTSFLWSVEGPHVKDYEERIGSVVTGPRSWDTTPLTAADLAGSSVTFYWKPSPSQIHPLNGGPVPRVVTLTATDGTTTCTLTRTYHVERNATDTSKQAEDYYTSNHRASTETNPLKGRIIDDHMEWHVSFGSHLPGMDFLPWHREFLARFNNWRVEFGYPSTIPWNPATPIPTGTDIDHTPRAATYNPNANRIPTQFTIAGGTSGSPPRLADFASLNAMSNSLEWSWHGQVHCDVGAGGGFGDMCDFSSPKDPIFWRWHGMIDVVYENYCRLAGVSCPPGPRPASDPWIADNATDLTNNGTVPSPPLHYVSPDIWNRNSQATCTPTDPQTGVVRNCGSTADHENPVTGVENYLYATLRNNRPGANLVVYAEVAVYVANASTGLAWPTNFGGAPAGIPLPETRQFITLHLGPGQETDIGPLPWVPPAPTPSDHWCLYIRVLSVQDSFGIIEGTDVGANTAGSNSIAWRNVKIVTASEKSGGAVGGGGGGAGAARNDQAAFIVRNIRPGAAALDLEIRVPDVLLRQQAAVELALSPRMQELMRKSRAQTEGFAAADPDGRTPTGEQTLLINQPVAALRGLMFEPREEAAVTVRVNRATLTAPQDIVIEQKSEGRVDGGILLHVQPGGATSPTTPPRFNFGAQYTLLHLGAFDAVELPGSTTPVLLRKRAIEHGFGGFFAYDFNEHVSFDSALYFFPEESITQALFGVKAGTRWPGGGLFGKVRPGVMRFGEVLTLRPTSQFFFVPAVESRTHFALDVGAVLELYPTQKSLLRFDFGDTIIRGETRRFAQGSTNFTTTSRYTHNFQFSAGAGFRF